jgi:hypothetical protein
MRDGKRFPIPVVDAGHTSALAMLAANIRAMIVQALLPLVIWPFILVWRAFWVVAAVFVGFFVIGVMDSYVIHHNPSVIPAVGGGFAFMFKGPYWVIHDCLDDDEIKAAQRKTNEEAADKPEAVELRRRKAALAEVDAFVQEANRRRAAGEYRDVPLAEFNAALNAQRVQALRELHLLPPPKHKKSPLSPGETIYDYQRRMGTPPGFDSSPLSPTAHNR